MTVNGAFSSSHLSLQITSPTILFSFLSGSQHRLLLYDNLIRCFSVGHFQMNRNWHQVYESLNYALSCCT